MRAGFDARAAFIDPTRGMGRVARELVGALIAAEPGSLVVFVPHGVDVPPRWYTGAGAVVPLSRPRRGAFLVDGPAWALTARRHRLDVLHLPTWGVPPAVPCPVVATFYDATPIIAKSPPHAWPRMRARFGLRSLRRATRIHAISRHAAAEAVSVVGLDPSTITVAHLAPAAAFTPTPRTSPAQGFLVVGGGDPHKNLDMVLAILADDRSGELGTLTIVGSAAHDTRVRDRVTTLGLAGRIRSIGVVSDTELAELYRTAAATLVPSLNEGFGLTALEAMASGCPVVASTAGALPEVCGDAALLLDPNDPEAWRAALFRLTREPELRARLSAAGIARAAAFSWSDTAAALWRLYREAKRA